MTLTYADRPVSAPRFRPQHYTTEPRAFGRAFDLVWRKPWPGPSEDRLLASQMQNTYAFLIQDEAIRQHGSLKKYAEEAGVDYQRLTKLLRGEAIMRLEDIANAHRHLHIPFPKPDEPHRDPDAPPTTTRRGSQVLGGPRQRPAAP